MSLCAACLLLLCSPPEATAAAPLTTGFVDDVYLSSDAAERATWLERTRAEGGSIVRLILDWSSVAPSRPWGLPADDPSNPAYHWSQFDRAVRDATAHGLQVLFTIYHTPLWADAPGLPRHGDPGTWHPNVRVLEAFARAAARRYSGQFPDLSVPGAMLPRVRFWQAWNEPNFSTNLEPQWVKVRGRWRPASPLYYRGMLNAVYRGVKAVRSDNFVVAAGTGPYGDPWAGGGRIMPVAFDRELFCLRGPQLAPLPCPDPPHLDAISHHPYGIEGPLWHALNADDAAVPDVYKLVRILRIAERDGHVSPRGHKRVWVTEVGWNSKPPNPTAVPERTRARWVEQALYVLWRQGVDTVTWFLIRDQPCLPNCYATSQSGMYFSSGRPKLGAGAFRLPFVTERAGPGRIRAWGKAPAPGVVQIQRLRGRRWIVFARMRAGTDQIFYGVLPQRGRARLRALAGGQTSLVWSQP